MKQILGHIYKDLLKSFKESQEKYKKIQEQYDNMFFVNENGKNTLKPEVQIKDIKLLTETIIKIRDNYKEALQELDLMHQREEELENQIEDTKKFLYDFEDKLEMKLPKFFRDLYNLDG